MNTLNRTSTSWPWGLAALGYALFILLTLPYTPRWWKAVLPWLQPHVMAWFLAAGGLVALFLAIVAWRASSRRRLPALLLLAAVGAAYAVLLATFATGTSPGNKFHLLQYGLLAYLLLNTFRPTHWRSRATLYTALALLVMTGIDEAIQGWLPNRFFDWMDILGNLLGGTLGAVAWIAASRWSRWRQPRTMER